MEFIIAIGLVAVVVIVVSLFVSVSTAARDKSTLPYRRVESLLTPAERSFYGVLKGAVDGQYEVMCKVRLMDLLDLPKGTPERQAHVNRIISKHVDFVLCRPSDFSPRLVIELDDASHQQKRRQERDDFLNEALHAAVLPLLRVTARSHYPPAELRSLIASAVASETA